MPSINATTGNTTGVAAAISASAALGAVITSVSLLCFWHCRQRERAAADKASKNKCVSIELNELEHFLHMTGEQPVSTLTWFRGDYAKTIQMLKVNVEKILQTNPWLTGRVYKQLFGKLVLEYEEPTYNTNHLNDFFVVLDPADSPISRDTPMDKLGTICTRHGLVIRNGSHEPLFRVMIVPCRKHPHKHFALVVSLSHFVGDGATFYKLHDMLCTNNDDNGDTVVPLIVERIASSSRQQQEALGKAEYGYLTSLGVLINLAWGMLRVAIVGPPPQEHFRFVDIDKMKQIKQQHAASTEVPFVSTNDILTSWFLQDTGCTHGVMNVNFRNRLHGHSDLHAGNYEGFLFYRRENSATPTLIRQSLSNLRRVNQHKNDESMPGFYESVTSTIALVTNWTSFAKSISSLKHCQEELHVPIYNVASATPYSYALLIIFRAGGGGPDNNKIGLYYSGQEHLLKKLHSAPFLLSEI